MKATGFTMVLALPIFTACSDVEKLSADGHHHEHELITTVELVFSAQSTDSELVFTWSDLHGHGEIEVDTIELVVDESYDLSVSFRNELESEPEDITGEIRDEGDEHQLFFTGSAVQGPATGDNTDAIIEHAYADTDGSGIPLGLENTVDVLNAGSGQLTLTLRHLPAESGQAVKTPGLAEQVAADGNFGSIGGANDAQVNFDVTTM